MDNDLTRKANVVFRRNYSEFEPLPCCNSSLRLSISTLLYSPLSAFNSSSINVRIAPVIETWLATLHILKSWCISVGSSTLKCLICFFSPISSFIQFVWFVSKDYNMNGPFLRGYSFWNDLTVDKNLYRQPLDKLVLNVMINPNEQINQMYWVNSFFCPLPLDKQKKPKTISNRMSSERCLAEKPQTLTT